MAHLKISAAINQNNTSSLWSFILMFILLFSWKSQVLKVKTAAFEVKLLTKSMAEETEI